MDADTLFGNAQHVHRARVHAWCQVRAAGTGPVAGRVLTGLGLAGTVRAVEMAASTRVPVRC
jgi:hypothetical protein